MLANNAARLAAVLTCLVASIVTGGSAALAANEPGVGGREAAPTPPPIGDPSLNWALIVVAVVAVAAVIALAVLVRAALRPRIVRHA